MHGKPDAIHVLERASAMIPVEGHEDAGGAVSGTATYGVNDVLPSVPTTGLFFPAVTSGGSVSSTSDGTKYTCTSPNGSAAILDRVGGNAWHIAGLGRMVTFDWIGSG